MAFLLFQLNSLRSRLILLVALAIAPIAVMTIVSGVREREHAIRVAEENLQQLTNLAAANEAQSIESARQILRDLASVPDLTGDQAHCSRLLANIHKQNPDYANFGLVQLNGDVTCTAIPSKTMVNLGDRTHFRRAVHLRRFVAGGYVFGRVIQKHTVNLTYPLLDEGQQVQAVLFAALDLTKLDRFVAESAEGDEPQPISTDDNLYLEYATPKGNVLNYDASLTATLALLDRYRMKDPKARHLGE